ncbi:TMEM143 family protein [Nannocystaceae bacterium ST9]
MRLDALLAAIADDPRAEGPALAKVALRVQDLLHLECRARLRELKRLWAPYDPNPEGVPRPAAGPEGLAACWRALDELLSKANYVPIDEAELARALTRQSVFPLALHTRLDDFAELRLWRRGLTLRRETLPRWFGMRRRTLMVESFERVVLAVRFQDADHFAGSKRRLAFTPGETTIKLFQDVPANDLEMIFPNIAVKMRWRDHLALWGPALIGGIGVLAKSLGPLMFVGGLIWLRMREGGGLRSLEGSEWAAVGLAASAAVGIVLFSIRQLSRFKARKIAFLQLLTRDLYFRNLDNNAGVFHRVLDSAEEEESAEAALGYALLRWHGPAEVTELDARGEAWLSERFGVRVDLETDDALAKLARLGVAVDEQGKWRALAPDEALAELDRRWAAS